MHSGYIFGVEETGKVAIVNKMKIHWFDKIFKVASVKKVCENLVVFTDRGKEFAYLD